MGAIKYTADVIHVDINMGWLSLFGQNLGTEHLSVS